MQFEGKQGNQLEMRQAHINKIIKQLEKQGWRNDQYGFGAYQLRGEVIKRFSRLSLEEIAAKLIGGEGSGFATLVEQLMQSGWLYTSHGRLTKTHGSLGLSPRNIMLRLIHGIEVQ